MTVLADKAAIAAQNGAPTRVDLLLITSMVKPGARVLDVGCGHGELLKLLETQKQVDGRGIEISQTGVNFCVAKGLAVIQGDADHDLENYPDLAFDYAILSQTLQATRHPKAVLEELIRIAHHVIVSFPNFGYWKIRAQILFQGRMPITHNLPEEWYDTPNIHLCTIKDFLALSELVGAKIERALALSSDGKPLDSVVPRFLHNLWGQQAVFLLTKGSTTSSSR